MPLYAKKIFVLIFVSINIPCIAHGNFFKAINDLVPFAKILAITMGVKFLTDRIMPHEKYYSFNQEGLYCSFDEKDKKKVRKKIYGLMLKNAIKGLSYMGLTYVMRRKGYIHTSIAVAAFGILDTLASLPSGILSPQVFLMLRNLGQKIDAKKRRRIQESIIKNKTQEDVEVEKNIIVDQDFINACKLAKKHFFFVPRSEIIKPLKHVEKEEEKFEEKCYNRLCFDFYLNSCGLLRLKNIVTNHNEVNEELRSLYSFGACRVANRYQEIENLDPYDYYAFLRDLGVRDIAYGYFSKKPELSNTWNLLPIEMLEYIFSFLSFADVRYLMEYANQLTYWKQSKNDNKIPQAMLIVIPLSNWGKLLNGANIKWYKNKDYVQVTTWDCNLRVSSNMVQMLLNIMKYKDFKNCIKYHSYYHTYKKTYRDKIHKNVELLRCQVKKNKDDIFIYTEFDDTLSYLYKEVEVITARKSCNETLQASSKIITIRFSTTNNSRKKERIKLEKNLYDTLKWLVGEDDMVELEYSLN